MHSYMNMQEGCVVTGTAALPLVLLHHHWEGQKLQTGQVIREAGGEEGFERVFGGVSGSLSALVAEAMSLQSRAPSSRAAIPACPSPWWLTHILAYIQVLKSLGKVSNDVGLVVY